MAPSLPSGSTIKAVFSPSWISPFPLLWWLHLCWIHPDFAGCFVVSRANTKDNLKLERRLLEYFLLCTSSFNPAPLPHLIAPSLLAGSTIKAWMFKKYCLWNRTENYHFMARKKISRKIATIPLHLSPSSLSWLHPCWQDQQSKPGCLVVSQAKRKEKAWKDICSFCLKFADKSWTDENVASSNSSFQFSFSCFSMQGNFYIGLAYARRQ